MMVGNFVEQCPSGKINLGRPHLSRCVFQIVNIIFKPIKYYIYILILSVR